MAELGGERIDIMEYSENPVRFIEDALSPAQILSVTLNEDEHRATVEVTADQQSLAIGRGGQNVRLAAKLTGWAIDIRPIGGEEEPVNAPSEVEAALETPETEVAEEVREEAVAESAQEEPVAEQEENKEI
jgi:N utilization substance protein A